MERGLDDIWLMPPQSSPYPMAERMSNDGNPSSNDGRAAKVRREVTRLLACIAEGADHYKVLEVKREASTDRVRAAYCRAVEQLHPLKCQDIIEADGVMRWKLSEVFLRVVEAFSVLSSPGRRVEYDGMLDRRPITPLPMPKLPELRHHLDTEAFNSHASGGAQSSNKVGLGSAFGYSEINAPRVRDRRKASRLSLQLPVRVSSPDDDWQEVTESRDVSRSGIKLYLSQSPKPGTMFVLELPMPLALRNHGFRDGMYVVKALVRHIKPDEGGYLVGAEFQE